MPINILLAQFAPPLPPKQGRYSIRGSRVVRKPQSIIRYTVTSHMENGKSFYKCANRVFFDYGEALIFCQGLNRCEAAKRQKASLHLKSFNMKCRQTISRISRALSRKSQMKTTNNLPVRRNSTSNSNENLFKSVIGNTLKEFSPETKMNTKSSSYTTWKKVWNGFNLKNYHSTDYGLYKRLILTEVNAYRSNHGETSLVSSSYLNDVAQKLANNYAHRQKVEVNPYAMYGMLYASVKKFLASSIVKSCYDTKSKYSYILNRPISRAAFSFTQIVWASTKKFGIGVQHHNGHLYVVLLFLPKGNKKGEFKQNVFKRKR
uniref:SCP domain-containing protein n=2 Tax=Strongyloides papillosus TaxID=174720 RepID=A0A0N5C953_STREA